MRKLQTFWTKPWSVGVSLANKLTEFGNFISNGSIVRHILTQFSSLIGLTYVTIEPTYLYAIEVSKVWAILLAVGIFSVINFPIVAGERSLIVPVPYPYDEYVIEHHSQSIGKQIFQ